MSRVQSPAAVEQEDRHGHVSQLHWERTTDLRVEIKRREWSRESVLATLDDVSELPRLAPSRSAVYIERLSDFLQTRQSSERLRRSPSDAESISVDWMVVLVWIKPVLDNEPKTHSYDLKFNTLLLSSMKVLMMTWFVDVHPRAKVSLFDNANADHQNHVAKEDNVAREIDLANEGIGRLKRAIRLENFVPIRNRKKRRGGRRDIWKSTRRVAKHIHAKEDKGDENRDDAQEKRHDAATPTLERKGHYAIALGESDVSDDTDPLGSRGEGKDKRMSVSIREDAILNQGLSSTKDHHEITQRDKAKPRIETLDGMCWRARLFE